MTNLTLTLHPSIKVPNLPSKFEGKFEDVTVISAIISLVSPFPEILELCSRDGNRKPGILYISMGAELGSLGMLDMVIGEEKELIIKIIPILHGG